MRRIDHYLKETASGLRRNGVVAFAAMSTAFIALFLFGLALVIAREFSLIITYTTGNVQVQVYLTDTVSPEAQTVIQSKLQGLSAVESATYVSKAQACERAKVLFQNSPALLANLNCDVLPASFQVKLQDATLFAQVTAALGCQFQTTNGAATQVCTEPGVDLVNDNSALLTQLNSITHVLQFGVLAIAFVMLGAAVALIANTLRMGMFARRKEIGIMRLVGATNWRIRIPFMIEGLVESLLGAAAAIMALFLVKILVIDRLRDQIRFFPWVRNSDLLSIAPLILVVATVIAIIAGTIGMRRFLDV
ncbi:MAG: cell division transport system permease protein [Actinomycetota bacterium]|jgi:cell division transport system permease protein|nr:cell division transport system permease protein [Actinomycetota bacterium]